MEFMDLFSSALKEISGLVERNDARVSVEKRHNSRVNDSVRKDSRDYALAAKFARELMEGLFGLLLQQHISVIDKANEGKQSRGWRAFTIKIQHISLIFPLPSTITQSSFCNDGVFFDKNETRTNSGATEAGCIAEHIYTRTANSSVNDIGNGVATNLRPWHGQNTMHPRHPLKNVHGILNIIGWGTMLPIGVIVARFFRNFPLNCDEWFNLHVVCQTLGYIVGVIGWIIGLWLQSSSKQHTSKTHRLLGIIIFTFATVQMLALRLRPRRVCKCWEIYHAVLGYALIGMIVANIFIGIASQGQEKWKWGYVVILGVLALIAISLQIFRWVKLIIHRRLPNLNTNSFHFP